MPSDPVDVLSLHAATQPAKVALVEDPPDGSGAATWTFAALEEWAGRVASALRSLGVAPGDRVVWCGPNSATVVALVHGCRKAGVTAVPLNYRLTPEEAAYVLDNCDAVAAFVDAESAALVTGARSAAPRLRHVLSYRGTAPGCEDGDALIAGAPALAGAPAAGAGVMIYTSGTTGRPKGAVRAATG